MKLGILTALWARPNITMIFLDRMMNIKNRYGIEVVAVGSDDEYRDECAAREIIYTDFENKPLGAKWNHGLKVCQNLDTTHMMILGSDDFVSDEFIEYELEFGKDIDFGGCKDLYMLGANPRRRGYNQFYYFRYKGYLVGPGRIFSRRILDLLGWQGWDNSRNAGLDGSIAKAVKRLGDTVKRGSFFIKDHDLFVVDVKTPGNISGIPGGAKPVHGKVEDYMHKYLPDEADRILKLLP